MTTLQNVATSTDVTQVLYITPDAFNQLMGVGFISMLIILIVLFIVFIAIIKKLKGKYNG